MKTWISRVAVGGFVVGAVLAGAGVSTADPMGDLDPLLSSSCSFNQIDKALHVVAPETASKLDAVPAQKDQLRQAYSQPAAQRKAAFQKLIAQQQQMGVTATTNPEFSAKMHKVVESCKRY